MPTTTSSVDTDFTMPPGLCNGAKVESPQQIRNWLQRGPFEFAVLSPTPSARMRCADEERLLDIVGFYKNGDTIALYIVREPFRH